LRKTYNKGLLVIAESLFTQCCPKCAAPNLELRESWYPTLGYGDLEFACHCCGLSLWPRINESPRQTYYRWLMDRLSF